MDISARNHSACISQRLYYLQQHFSLLAFHALSMPRIKIFKKERSVLSSPYLRKTQYLAFFWQTSFNRTFSVLKLVSVQIFLNYQSLQNMCLILSFRNWILKGKERVLKVRGRRAKDVNIQQRTKHLRILLISQTRIQGLKIFSNFSPLSQARFKPQVVGLTFRPDQTDSKTRIASQAAQYSPRAVLFHCKTQNSFISVHESIPVWQFLRPCIPETNTMLYINCI